jgi:hypothetical protein
MNDEKLEGGARGNHWMADIRPHTTIAPVEAQDSRVLSGGGGGVIDATVNK